jgi:hypothetical protein
LDKTKLMDTGEGVEVKLRNNWKRIRGAVVWLLKAR